MSEISLSLNGSKLSGWEEVEVTKSMASLCGDFTVTQSALNDGDEIKPLPIFPGDQVTVNLSGAEFMVGWVDGTSPKIDARTHSITVNGREKTCDLVDCGIPSSALHWKNVDLKQLVNALCSPFGISVESCPADIGDPFKKFSAEPGDSVFTVMNKACTLKGVLPVTTASGNISLIKAGGGRANDRLVYGVNIRAASGKFDNKDRYSQYIVRGQNGSQDWGTDNKTIHIEAKAEDPSITRFRPLYIVAGNELDQKTAQRRVNWEAQTRAAKASPLEVTVQGWTQSNGALWECARLVSVEIPYLIGDGSQDFLISSIKYTYGSGGTFSTLSLVRPDAFDELPATKKVAADKDAWASVRKAVQGK